MDQEKSENLKQQALYLPADLFRAFHELGKSMDRRWPRKGTVSGLGRAAILLLLAIDPAIRESIYEDAVKALDRGGVDMAINRVRKALSGAGVALDLSSAPPLQPRDSHKAQPTTRRKSKEAS